MVDEHFGLVDGETVHEDQHLTQVVLHAGRPHGTGRHPHDGDRFFIERRLRWARDPVEHVLQHRRDGEVVLGCGNQHRIGGTNLCFQCRHCLGLTLGMNVPVVHRDLRDVRDVNLHPFRGEFLRRAQCHGHDHVDFFKTADEVTTVFKNFALTIPADGFLIYCKDDAGSRSLGENVNHCTTYSYGTDPTSDLKIDQIELTAAGSRGRAVWKGTVVGHIELQVPGKHNLLNAAGTLALAMALELNPAAFLSGLHSFRGAGRRFELKATVNGIRVIDDYGHHPTEIAVTLEAARRYADTGRVLVIFQPHRYSRTQAFLAQFAESLDVADDVTLLEIYAASEKPILGVSSELIAEKMQHGIYLPNFIEAAERIVEIAKPGDVILTLGAGDVNSLAPIIADGLAKRFG